LISLFSSNVCAQQAYRGSEKQAEPYRNALYIAGLGFPIEPLEISRRKDLDTLLSATEQRHRAGDIYFYEMRSPPSPTFDYDPVWIVAVARSTGDVYQLAGFDVPPRLNESRAEFNRLASQLALSISTGEEAISLGKLFMECCVRAEPNDVVVDEDALRLAVQDYYYEAYGDAWRTLDAYVEWWQAFKVHAPDLTPKVEFENGSYSVVLKRVLTVAGRTPQLQDCHLEISRTGSVLLVAIQPIFPQRIGWLFYDTIRPSFCNSSAGDAYFTTPGCETLPGGWNGFAAAMAGNAAEPRPAALDKNVSANPRDDALNEDLLRVLARLLPPTTAPR